MRSSARGRAQTDRANPKRGSDFPIGARERSFVPDGLQPEPQAGAERGKQAVKPEQYAPASPRGAGSVSAIA